MTLDGELLQLHCKMCNFGYFIYFLFFVGVIDAQGKFIVGGHLGGNQEKPTAGTVIKYTHRNRPAARDVVTIVGPTNASLRVMVSKEKAAA